MYRCKHCLLTFWAEILRGYFLNCSVYVNMPNICFIICFWAILIWFYTLGALRSTQKKYDTTNLNENRIVFSQWNGILKWRSINYKLHIFSTVSYRRSKSSVNSHCHQFSLASCINFDITGNVSLYSRSVCFATVKCWKANRLLREQLSNIVTSIYQNALKDKSQMATLARTNTSFRRVRQTK